MAGPRTVGGVGIEFDGLTEAVKALRRLDGQYARETTGLLRGIAKDIQIRSQGRIGNHSSYRGPTNKGMIGRFATQKHAGVKLRAKNSPWALKGEYGEKTTHVWGHPTRQTAMDRRTAAPFRPPTAGGDMSKNKGGYWIQPTIRKRFPHITKELGDGLQDLIADVMRREGVKVTQRG